MDGPPTGLRAIPFPWLDVTRLASRAGRGPLTGVDRVEIAYLRHLLGPNSKFLCRTTRGYLLLDEAGAAALAEMADGTREPGPADALSRVMGRGGQMRHRVEATLRGYAIDRCLPNRLGQMLARCGGSQFYLNVGHSNLSEATLAAFHARTTSKTAVMIHDLIPLQHPHLMADGMAEAFAGRIDRVRKYADLVILNSEDTAGALAAHWADQDAPAWRVVAPLGVRSVKKIEGPRNTREFLMLGTIEPRKNHALMLDVWDMAAEQMAAEDMPVLHIVGAPGWKSDDVMARIKAHPQLGQSIHYHGALPDRQVETLLGQVGAVLFPSVAEGYGYPPLEAALAGTVSILPRLPIYRETLGECGVYVNAFDAYNWLTILRQHMRGQTTWSDLSTLKVPSWDEHFRRVAEEIIPPN